MAETVLRYTWSIAILLLVIAPLRAQSARPVGPIRREARIQFLLAQLAESARSSEDLSFAVRAQAQAAILLWPKDREGARNIFRRAFESLAPSVNGLSPADRRQLRAELLNQVAGLDPELAEGLARALVYSPEGAKEAGAPALTDGRAYADQPGYAASVSRADIERRELLISVALQIVERDPHRAMTLGQLSLGGVGEYREVDGRALFISPNFARLLGLMRTVDATLADLLFSSAVTRLERYPSRSLADIHTLGAYLVASETASTKEAMNKALVVRFLNLAFSQIMQYGSQPANDLPAADRGPSLDDKSAIYFIGRQLNDLFGRHLPDRVLPLRTRIAELTDATSFDRVIDPVSVQPSGPADISREALASQDERERDGLYARAAMAWLSKGEVDEAESAALKIADRAVRDRVLAQVARRQTDDGHIEDAVAVAGHIEDDAARLGVLVRLAGASLMSRDRVRATALLNEAEAEALKAAPSVARAQALLTIVSSYLSFDTIRAFEVMHSAIKALNQLPPRPEAGAPSSPASARPADGRRGVYKVGDLYNLNFEGTLSVLARTDFDRALFLAQQVTGKEASVIAQLAVCRGGLSGPASNAQATADAEAGGLH